MGKRRAWVLPAGNEFAFLFGFMRGYLSLAYLWRVAVRTESFSVAGALTATLRLRSTIKLDLCQRWKGGRKSVEREGNEGNGLVRHGEC